MGNLGFDPLGLAPKDDPAAWKEIQTKELNNGRLAMIAIAAFTAEELVSHQESESRARAQHAPAARAWQHLHAPLHGVGADAAADSCRPPAPAVLLLPAAARRCPAVFEHLALRFEKEVVLELDDVERDLNLPVTPLPSLVVEELKN